MVEGGGTRRRGNRPALTLFGINIKAGAIELPVAPPAPSGATLSGPSLSIGDSRKL